MILLALATLALGAVATSLPARSNESEYLSDARRVTADCVKAGVGYVSPDGETIVCQAIREGYPFYQIYTQPLAGGTVTRTGTGRGRATCRYLRPSGERILFALSHLDSTLAQTEQEAIRQAEEDRRSGTRRRFSWVIYRTDHGMEDDRLPIHAVRADDESSQLQIGDFALPDLA